MCKIRLRFDYFQDNVGVFEIKEQIKIVRKELSNNLNKNTNFVQCQVEYCGVGKENFCPKYKYNFFGKVFIITVLSFTKKPKYRLRIKCFDLFEKSYVSLTQAYASIVANTKVQ